VSKLILLIGAVALTAIAAVTAVASSSTDVKTFNLAANPKFVKCLAKFPTDPSRPPSATVEVRKGDLNDHLALHLRNVKPGLGFDLFTLQRSTLDSAGKVISPAQSVGLAWYQSDIQADDNGNGDVEIRTILADQIFGVNADQVPANPINTFNLGFWFNNPQNAVDCGFDPTHPTPFNGEHNAGPLAMISVPDAKTGLGPLCLNPDAGQPSGCNP
jgi:hypothetical protein